jgi:biotin carboxyl carrier protein
MKKLLVTVNGIKYEVEVEVIEDDDNSQICLHTFSRKCGVQPKHFESGIKTNTLFSPAKPKAPAGNHDEAGVLKSPINGILLEINVKPGQSVAENDVLFVLESMKMKTNISSPRGESSSRSK